MTISPPPPFEVASPDPSAEAKKPALPIPAARGKQNTARGYRTSFSAGVSRLAAALRPVIDRWHYDRLLNREQARRLVRDTRENPYEFNVPYRVLLAWSYPQAILAAHGDLSPLIAGACSSLFFLRAKAQGAKQVMTPRVIPAYSLDTYAYLGYLESESCDLLAEEVDPAPVVRFVAESVLSGWYVSTNVNKYYIPGAAASRRDFRHPLLVTGCDAARGIFSVITYANDGDYAREEVSAEKLGRAIVSRAVFERMARPDHKGAVKRLRRYRPAKGVPRTVSLHSVAAQLTDYMESRLPPAALNNPAPAIEEFNYSPDFLASCAFGVSTYDCYTVYFQHVLAHPKELDFRVTRTLWEHKEMMLIRIQYLEQVGAIPGDGEISAKYQEVVDLALKLRMACYSWSKQQGGREFLSQAHERLARMRQVETDTIEQVLACLD